MQVTLSDGTTLVLDAGTGIRNLGLAVAGDSPRLNILLTHLHMDHIQGLMFFAPLFRQSPRSRSGGPRRPAHRSSTVSPGDAFLDRLHSTVTARWGELGGPHSAVELASEHAELEVAGSNVQEDAPRT